MTKSTVKFYKQTACVYLFSLQKHSISPNISLVPNSAI